MLLCFALRSNAGSTAAAAVASPSPLTLLRVRNLLRVRGESVFSFGSCQALLAAMVFCNRDVAELAQSCPFCEIWPGKILNDAVPEMRAR
jgi:hypothetical protein